jgi:hypothetical protein
MTRPARLRSVPAPAEARLDTPEHCLRILIRDRDRAQREIAEIDAQMLAYRKRYAAERGEFMLPTIARLRRELLGG